MPNSNPDPFSFEFQLSEIVSLQDINEFLDVLGLVAQ